MDTGSQIVNTSLLQNDSVVFKLTNHYLVNTKYGGNFTIQVYSSLSGDQNLSNDTGKISLSFSPVPDFNFRIDSGSLCNPNLGFRFIIPFYNTINYSGGRWDFNDGTPLDSGSDIYHIFPRYGKYIVKFIPTVNYGCTFDSRDQDTIYYQPLPDSNFVIYNMGNNNYSFMGTDTFRNNKYRWQFGVPNSFGTATGRNVTFTSPNSNIFNTKYLVTNINNCTSRSIKSSFLSINEEYNSNEGIDLYPNPVFDNIINYRLEGNHLIKSLRIIDIQGKIITSQFSNISSTINIEKLSPGFYLLEFYLSNQQKVVKKFSKL